MKNFILTLFLYFSLFAACNIYAGNNDLTINYPATLGTYNKVILATQVTTDHTCNAGNAGLLYMAANKTLELCAMSNNGIPSPVQITAGQTCFNRFCSCNATVSSCSSTCAFNAIPAQGGFQTNPCPTGYTWGQYTNGGNLGPINDSITNGNYTTYSTVCCSSSVLAPTS